MPAGARLQYFEATYANADADAPAAIDALLTTFDGAEETADTTLRNMLVGGLAGGIAGIATAVLRRRRQQRLAAAREA